LRRLNDRSKSDILFFFAERNEKWNSERRCKLNFYNNRHLRFPNYAYLARSIHSMSLNNQISSVLRARLPDTDMINVVEALAVTPENFQHAFDVALEMENRNLVKLLYSNFNAQKVIVELTLPGKSQNPDQISAAAKS
jgi:hypothetical protein